MAMFPPAIPHLFIRWLTEPGDVVYDPFAGRGTAPLEACLLGRRGMGSDANPLACVLTRAKVAPPSREGLVARLDELDRESKWFVPDDEPAHIQMLFSRETLGQLLWLRRDLDANRRVDGFLLAVLLGMLHANAGTDGVPRGLTVSMPNTFSMSPNYVRGYIAQHELIPPVVDVPSALRTRALRFLDDVAAPVVGKAWKGDAGTSHRELILKQAPTNRVRAVAAHRRTPRAVPWFGRTPMLRARARAASV
jgi:site-specific DNA-methyltransferase (adenine-specific)